jgi:hypothetical protein
MVESTIDSIKRLLLLKGGEYAGSDDRLANFKRGAMNSGVTPLQVLHIYLSKHYDAFSTFVKDTAAGNLRELSEPIEGRLDDLINYCLLAKALIKEEREIAHAKGMLDATEKYANWEKAPKQAATEMGLHAGNGRVYDDRVWHSPPHTGTGVPAFRDTCDTERAPGNNDNLHRR